MRDGRLPNAAALRISAIPNDMSDKTCTVVPCGMSVRYLRGDATHEEVP